MTTKTKVQLEVELADTYKCIGQLDDKFQKIIAQLEQVIEDLEQENHELRNKKTEQHVIIIEGVINLAPSFLKSDHTRMRGVFFNRLM